MSSTTQSGKVYLVGAGPGHPELLTLKAAELLRNGDVIVYDRLIQEEVLALARPSAERVYMGKPVGKHDSRQEEIQELLVRKAREGKSVVRLKGGDPFLFGRGGEEAEYLADHGIPFEVIPGVCSALSAPLSAGISVTHRDASSSVAIVTGHNCNGAESRVDWGALARIDTLVFLMCVHNIEKIAQRLIDAGRDPSTPTAMVQMAFWHDEQVLTGTLATIAEKSRNVGVKSPATLVVGEVVRLREKLKVSQRDLSRSDGHVTPLGPAPDELLRIAAGGLGSQVLAWALESGLFDKIETALPVCDLAHELKLDPGALNEIMYVLVAMRLVESTPEGYRNLELASRYLRRESHNLIATLLADARESNLRSAIAQFAREGRQTALQPPASQTRADAAEAFASLAESVLDSREFHRTTGPVLIVGFAGDRYRETILAHSPARVVELWNPAGEKTHQVPSGPFEVVIVSGILEWCRAADLESILSRIRTAPGALLMCLDSICSVDDHPALFVALRGLMRQLLNGKTHSWSVERVIACLEHVGFSGATCRPVSGGGALVLARRHSEAAIAAESRKEDLCPTP